jgi:hypothetical protein
MNPRMTVLTGMIDGKSMTKGDKRDAELDTMASNLAGKINRIDTKLTARSRLLAARATVS